MRYTIIAAYFDEAKRRVVGQMVDPQGQLVDLKQQPVRDVMLMPTRPHTWGTTVFDHDEGEVTSNLHRAELGNSQTPLGMRLSRCETYWLVTKNEQGMICEIWEADSNSDGYITLVKHDLADCYGDRLPRFLHIGQAVVAS